MQTYRVVELHGDGISPELSRSVHTVAAALSSGLEFVSVDLSEPNRARRGHALYEEAAGLLQEHRVGLKYPTATTAESPNAVLRDLLDFAVIHRPVATIPGIATNFKRQLDVDVVRIATGGTYEDPGRRVNRETAVSLRVIERRPSLLAARFAFRLAHRRGTHVVSASKYTIQKETDGLFEEAVAEVAREFPRVPHRRELFDSLLAGIVMKPERYAVIVTPNEYGDFLSDAACGLIGSIGLGDSSNYAFDERGEVSVAMFDPAGGTAPDIAGRDLCNPSAALLSLANLLVHVGEAQAGERVRGAVLSAIASGRSTADIGGRLTTREFTAEVVRRAGLAAPHG
ncbi:MAG: isocitrate dehydrogenase [Planctomycetes bacterium]|nr:isocitrate dehydrogenase [Planctomycetota bacterium]